MNVYDFDKTIYGGDSTADFYLFSLKRHKKSSFLLPRYSVRSLNSIYSEKAARRISSR